MGCWSRRPRSTRASVEYPVLPFLPGNRPRRTKRISASCCGEATVKSSPARRMISSCNSSTRSRRRAVISPSRYGSILTPAASIRASTCTSGSSISRKSRSRPSSTRRGRWAAATRHVSTARVAAAASARGPSTSTAPSSAPASENRPRSFSGTSGASRYAATAVSNAGPHGVRGEEPQRGQPVGAGDGHLHDLAAGVDGDGEAVLAVLPRLERHGRLRALERRRERPHVGLVREARAGAGPRAGGRARLSAHGPRGRVAAGHVPQPAPQGAELVLLEDGVDALHGQHVACLLYTSDAADEEDSVDLGGRR